MLRHAAPCLFLLAAVFPCAGSNTGDPAGKPPAGYHDLTIGTGAGKTVVRVADSAKPHLNGGSSSDDHYDPQNMDLGKTSSFAKKSFSTEESAVSRNDVAQETQGQHSFMTHAFAGTADYNQADRTYRTVAFAGSARSSNQFSKTYSLPTLDSGTTRAFAVKSSEFQGKSALVQAPGKVDPFAAPSALSEKTFFDPEMKHVRRDPYASDNLDVSRMVKLPNRPLSIDEVRALINHEQVPDLDSKPDEPSRALNDPKWEPPTLAPMVHEGTPVAPPAELDKEGDLPAPGEMAQPAAENPRPLSK